MSLGVISTSNSDFRPNAAISRAEAMKMLLSVAALKDASFVAPTDATSSYADVTVDWQIKYIEHAKSLGIVSAAANFRPQDAITRAESAKVIVNTMNLAK